MSSISPVRVSVLGIIWPVVLSLVVLAVVAHFTYDPGAFDDVGERLNPWLLAAAVATVATRVFFGGWRLDYLSHGRLGLGGGLRIQIIWDFLAYITPSTIGGGPLMPAVISRERSIPFGEATSIMLFAMLLDQITFAVTILVLLVCMNAMEVIPDVLGAVGYWSILLFFAGFLIWVSLFAYGTVFKPHLLARVAGVVLRIRILDKYRDRLRGAVGDFKDHARLLRSKPLGFYFRGFVLTLLPWLSRYALMVLLAWSVYPGLDVVLAAVRAAALNVATIGLPLPGGAGGVEALYAAFYGPPMLPEQLVAPTLLAWRLLSYYAFIVVGSYFAMRYIRGRVAAA